MGLALISAGGGSELWKFGTHERVTRGTPLMLWSYVSETGANSRFTTLRRSGTQVGYTVTAGMTLILTRVMFRGNNSGHPMSLGYSDADLGLNADADGANPVHLDG